MALIMRSYRTDLQKADRDGKVGVLASLLHSLKQLGQGAVVHPPIPRGALHGVRLA